MRGKMVPLVKVGLNPHISFTQGHEGRHMEDPQTSQAM
jgi:hypothetical protein